MNYTFCFALKLKSLCVSALEKIKKKHGKNKQWCLLNWFYLFSSVCRALIQFSSKEKRANQLKSSIRNQNQAPVLT